MTAIDGRRRPRAPQPAAVDLAARASRSRRTDARHSETTPDRFDAGGTRSARRAAKPYAALALRGDFTGYLQVASGQELFVSIKLGPDAGRRPPVVMLDGIAARHDRNQTFEGLVRDAGRSIITIYLPGQGETLVRDLETGGRSLHADIEQEDQARAVVDVLDALGIQAPVGICGLSYGGAIAAQCKRQFADRFGALMVVAPFVRSQGQQNTWGAFMNNPWNPWGAAMYRSATKAALVQLFGPAPDTFRAHPDAFHEGLFRLTMGLEDFDLRDAVRGQRDVHFLVVPEDGASPPRHNAEAHGGVATGSFATAPAADAGKHDLVRGDGPLVADWIARVMDGKVEARPVGG